MNVRKIILSAMLIAFLAMLVTAMVYQVNSRMAQSPMQKIQAQSTQSTTEEAPLAMNMVAMLGAENMTEEMAAQAGKLMQAMQVDPNNMDTLLSLALLFYEAQDYVTMINFVNRASTLDPTSAQATYLAGIAYTNLGEGEAAVQSFELSLSLYESPITRYNLAIVYLYTLDNKEKAKEELEKALLMPELSADLKANIEAELAGL